MRSKERIVRLGVIAVLMLIAASLRFSTINLREFWYDEAFSGVLIQLPWQMMFDVIRDDVHPFTYYSLLKLWVGLFGITDFSIRSFSAVCGILMIPVSVFFMRELLAGRKLWAQYIPAVFIACSPFFIAYAQEARTYSFLGLLMLLSGYFFYRGLMRSPLAWSGDWFFFSLSIGFSFVSHYVVGFGILTFYAFLLYYARQHHFFDGARFRLFLKTHCLTLLPAAVLFFAWLPSLIYQLKHGGNLGWIPQAEFSFIPRSLYAFLFGVDAHAIGVPPVYDFPAILSTSSAQFLLFTAVLLIWCISYQRMRQDQQHKAALLYITTISIAPLILVIFASLCGMHVYVERYLTGYGIFLIMLISLLLAQFSMRTVGIVLVVYILIVNGIMTQQRFENPGYRDVATAIRTRYADERIIVNDPLTFLMMRYYAETGGPIRVELYNSANKDRFDLWPLFDSQPIIETAANIRARNVVISSGPLDTALTPILIPTEQQGDFTFYTHK